MVSEAKLTTYLRNRLYRDVREASDRAQFEAEIPQIVVRLKELGQVNDREAGAAKLRQKLRTGHSLSSAVFNSALSSQVSKEIIEQELPGALQESIPAACIAEGEDSKDQAHIMATLALKNSRRGPYRIGDKKIENYKRDEAWLMRRGFQYSVVRAVMMNNDNDNE